MSTKGVWVFADGDLLIYHEDSSGNLVEAADSPYAIPCYLESVTITGSVPFERKGVTGRGRRRLVRRSNTYDDITVEAPALLFKKSLDLDLAEIFDPSKRLRLVFSLSNLAYTSGGALFEESFSASRCFAVAYSVTGQDNETMKVSATFNAESLL